ncbi:OmpA family protein [Flavobacteriaceae bacterium Ap0902]|nr:OmpA family protein [Flavobacteriaceae bacterium Ap0902]
MNLLDSVKSEINSIVIDKISNYLNVARGNTSNAITATVPSILGYLTEKSKTDAGADSILKVATDSELLGMFKDKTYQENFERNRDSLMAKGNSALIEVFGDKEAKFSEEISKYANINKEAADGILASIFPLILSVIGNKLSKNTADKEGLRSLLESEKESTFAAIPAGLASLGGLLGLTGLSADTPKSSTTTSTVKTDTVKPVETATPKPTAAKVPQEDRKTYIKEDENKGGGMMKWLLPLLGIIIAAVLIYFLMKQCNPNNAETTTTEEVVINGVAEYTLNADDVVVNAAGEPLLGADGAEMLVDGITYKLNDDNYVVDIDGNKVFDMDGKEILIVDELANAPVEVMGEYDSENNRFIYDIGDDMVITLPNGETLTVGDNSTEAKLFNFLSDDARMISDDKTQDWIVLDRVYFETGSDNLDVSSLEQLNRITKIMNAYPNTKLKLGGYTDNQGGQAVNQPLSQRRAESVMQNLVNSGVDGSRLEAEGYGQDHFVCPANDTPECMAQNRRVDIRVTAK